MKHACTCPEQHEPLNPGCAMYAERDHEIDREESTEESSIGDTAEAYLANLERDGQA